MRPAPGSAAEPGQLPRPPALAGHGAGPALHAPGRPPGHGARLPASVLGARGRAEALSGPGQDTRASWALSHTLVPRSLGSNPGGTWTQPLARSGRSLKAPAGLLGVQETQPQALWLQTASSWGLPARHVPGPLRAPSGRDPWTTGRRASESRDGPERWFSCTLPGPQVGLGSSKPPVGSPETACPPGGTASPPCLGSSRKNTKRWLRTLQPELPEGRAIALRRCPG